jgi:hypothetical protein
MLSVIPKSAGLVVAGLAALSVSACATHPANIAPAPVDSGQYAGMSCQELLAESARLIDEIRPLHENLANRANLDTVQFCVALLGFLPAIILLEGESPAAGHYAALRGQHEAIETAAKNKGCHLFFPQGAHTDEGVG